MKILQACPYAWDVPGGVQVHVRQLSAHLRDRGHEVLIVAPARHRDAVEDARIVGRALPIPYQGTVAPICFSPRSFVEVGRALREFRPDVVHAHEPTSPSTGAFAAMRSKVPVVATFHAYAERSRLLDAAAPILRSVWRRLAVRIAVSNAAASFYRSRFGAELEVIPNGVDVAAFSGAEPDPDLPHPWILWVGRLDPQKGFPIAVRAFGMLAGKFPDLSFVVVGEGRDRGAVNELAPQARKRVAMRGAVPHDRLPPLVTGADGAVFPALGQESFGMVLVEAMAAGVPVVASAIPGYREVVRDGVDGLLVPPGDPAAVAGAIERLLCEPELAERLKGAGRQRAGEFDWARIVTRLETIYRRVVTDPPASDST